MTTKDFVGRWAGALACVGALLLASSADAQAPVQAPEQNQVQSGWFRYGAGIDKAWDIAAHPGRQGWISIKRKGEELGVGKRILVLYPRPSSAYDIAITKILQVFETKGLSTQFTVINFTMDDRRGTEAIQFAEKNKVDLIFSMGSESTAWLYDHYRGGSIPVVSVCAKDPVQLG